MVWGKRRAGLLPAAKLCLRGAAGAVGPGCRGACGDARLWRGCAPGRCLARASMQCVRANAPLSPA